jgi:hypothetical protein
MAIIETLGAREILDSRGNPHKLALQFQVVHLRVRLKLQNFEMAASVT